MSVAIHRNASPGPVPFRSSEEAWFWTMATLMARQDGADADWRPSGPVRPCDPDDVLRCLDLLNRRQAILLSHVRVLRAWGLRQESPADKLPAEEVDVRLWQQAMGHFEWALRGRGIVR